MLLTWFSSFLPVMPEMTYIVYCFLYGESLHMYMTVLKGVLLRFLVWYYTSISSSPHNIVHTILGVITCNSIVSWCPGFCLMLASSGISSLRLSGSTRSTMCLDSCFLCTWSWWWWPYVSPLSAHTSSSTLRITDGEGRGHRERVLTDC